MIGRILAALAALWCVTSSVAAADTGAQQFSGLARVDTEQSRLADGGRDGLRIDLHLSQGVPYRLFTLDEPPRLVLDFREIDWTGFNADTALVSERVRTLRYGTFRPGWSRMVAELAGPMTVTEAGLSIDPETAAAHLAVVLDATDAGSFAAAAGAPYDPRWDLPPPEPLAEAVPRRDTDSLIVVLDPGHGGVDPGAERGDVNEKTLMLTFARELRETLVRSGGYQVVLTRDDDRFVSLERRVAIAHEAGADVFLSLHADSLAEGQAHGATVHVLARDASDVASAKLAERHNRDDLLAGLDLTDADDVVTDVLLGLARQETQPRTEALADALVSGMAQRGGPMNRKPLRWAAFSVLKAADIPSVLIEIGFLSSPRDLVNLQDGEWRQGMAEGIRDGLEAWRASDAARRALVRQ